MIHLADLGMQTREIWSSLEGELRSLIESSSFIGGPTVSAFEKEFANYVGTQSCVGVGNGTDALELILEALGIGRGDEVLVPAFSYAATSEAVLRVGARPVFVDVAADLLVDPDLLKQHLTPRVRAVIPVHLYGNPFDVSQHLGDEIAAGLIVVEDAAQAHGVSVDGQRAGALGTAAAFSFYPGKNLGAWGDAGAVTTSDLALDERIRRLANHGRLSKFDHEIAGRNSRLDTLQAAVLSAKLRLLDEWVARRQTNATRYLAELASLEWLELPTFAAGASHSWHQFSVRVANREKFRAHMEQMEVQTGIHYPYALPDLPFHRKKYGSFPEARRAAREVVSLPVGEHLTDNDVSRVVGAVEAYLQ